MSEQPTTVTEAPSNAAPPASVGAPPVGSGGAPPLSTEAGSGAVEQAPAEQPKIEVAESVSKHFAELERRRAAFEAERKAYAEKLKADEADRKALEEFRKNRDAAKKEPFKAFGLLGLTPDDIAKGLMEAPEQPTEEQKAAARIEALEKKLAQQEEQRLAAERARIEAENVKTATEHLTKFVASSKYEAIKHLGDEGIAQVFDRMTAAFAKTNELPDHDAVCADVEAQIDAFVERMAALPKYQKKFAAKSEPQASPAEVKAPAEKKPATADPKAKQVVLSNKTSADTPPGSQPVDAKSLRDRAVRTLQERMAAKAAALKKGAEK